MLRWPASPQHLPLSGKTIEPLFVVKYGEWQREDWNDELEASTRLSIKPVAPGKRPMKPGTQKASESESESDSNRSPNPILNIAGTVAARSGKDKGSQPRTNDVQPQFLADVEIAETAPGLGCSMTQAQASASLAGGLGFNSARIRNRPLPGSVPASPEAIAGSCCTRPPAAERPRWLSR